MKTEIIAPSELARALEVLRNGGLVAFPTDTVYGLGALARDNDAIESIYDAKDRPREKAIPILIADVEDLPAVAREIPKMAEILAAKFWPGPLTCVIPKRHDLAPAVSATDTVAVRIPDHAVARELLRAAGPLAVTSANLSGKESPLRAQEVIDQLNGRIPLIIDGGQTPGGVPSTLVDCTGLDPIVLRAGPISLDEIRAALK